MTQLSSTASTCAAQWKMWLIKVFSVIYFTAVCAAQNDEDVTVVYSSITPTTVLPVVITTAYEPPIPTLELQSAWLDVFPSEKVKFRCNITGSSDWTFTWFRNGAKVQSDPNVSLSAEGSILTITAAKIHSGSYSCKGLHKTKRVFSAVSNSHELKVSEPPIPTLELQSAWLDVFPSEKVKLNCSITGSSDWTFIWFRNGAEVQSDPNVSLSAEGSMLTITAAKIHSGSYSCKGLHKTKSVFSAVSNSRELKVSEPPIPTLELQSAWLDVFPSEKVKLNCSITGSSDWTFIWFRNGAEVQSDPNVSLSAEGSKLTITAAKIHSGSYSCKGLHKTKRVFSAVSNSRELKVSANKPKPIVSQNPNHDKMFPGESVNFTCGNVLSTGWEYLWYHNETEIPVSGSDLIIVSVDHPNSGQYYCKAKRGKDPFYTEDSEKTTLKVSDPPKPSLNLLSLWTDVFENETVEFLCEVDSPDWEPTWYHNQMQLQEDSVVTLDSEGLSLNITSITQDYQGDYACKANLHSRKVRSGFSNKINIKVYENIPKPTLIKVPGFNEMFVGETVKFTCNVDVSTGWNYQWYKDGKDLTETSKTISIRLGLSDGGKYFCKATRGEVTSTDISNEIPQVVHEIPAPDVIQETPWLDVFPHEIVKFSCKLKGGLDWIYTWYKDGQELVDNRATLSISSDSTVHAGRYTCMGRARDRSVNSTSSSGLTLTVYDEKPRVILGQNPNHSVMYTEDPVSFSCHINVSSGWEYQWYKDGSLLSESGNNHTIPSVLTTHTGSYKCKTKRGDFQSDLSQTISLHVEERPKADIILLTGWSEVFSTDSLVLKCGVVENGGNGKWNYTWYKNNIAIDWPTSDKHTVTPQDDPEQSLYTCKGNRAGRPSYSKMSDQFTTKNLLLKRRVLLSISGFIFFGIIAVFLGCILLRVIRKPAKDEYKPEEVDLFLNMSQLKGRDDAPCPLVEYITDAALNAPSKEEDENGVICSETTPLPITSQDDQAVTTESQDATENNGGLVSFKQ